MEFTCVVLYEKQLVYYNVFTKDGWTYTARLLQRNTHFASPPPEVHLYKEGLYWQGNAESSLIKCLGFEIDNKYSTALSYESSLNLVQSGWSYR